MTETPIELVATALLVCSLAFAFGSTYGQWVQRSSDQPKRRKDQPRRDETMYRQQLIVAERVQSDAAWATAVALFASIEPMLPNDPDKRALLWAIFCEVKTGMVAYDRNLTEVER